MPEETMESKARKLAAARKKLKEYQKRGGSHDDAVPTTTNSAGIDLTNAERCSSPAHSQDQQYSTGSVSSNLSEIGSETELNLNGLIGNATAASNNVLAFNESGSATPKEIEIIEPAVAAALQPMPTVASYFNAATPQVDLAATVEHHASGAAAANFFEQHSTAVTPEPTAETTQKLHAIQVLISEKAQLTSELNRYRATCREKDLELEELRTQYSTTTQRLEDLQQRFLATQQASEQLRKHNAELQHKLAQINAKCEDQATHVDELKKQLSITETRAGSAEQQYKEKCNELEMSQIRIRQLSDETNISTDNRVETLTQTQFMYEQQIRDLQAMVQQLQQDKDQANTQYQNYAQHLNSEVTNLNEKNAELMDECTKLQERERQLIDHISGLERDIQKNISRQDMLKKEKNLQTAQDSEELKIEVSKLNDKINDFDFERHEFQLKIKSQEDRLEQLTAELQVKDHSLEQLQKQMEYMNAEQPDKIKLLATMESDKVAASRALSQNVEMKQQLDELEQRFVQLTNDKAELTNKLDAEEYANREMRTNYASMEERLRSIDERFKFKDEEMIRLSHENMDLLRKNLILQQRIDSLQHYEAIEYNDKYASDEVEENISENNRGDYNHHQHAEHDHDHHHDHNHHHDHDHHGDHDHHHDHESDHHEHAHDEHKHSESDSCDEAREDSDLIDLEQQKTEHNHEQQPPHLHAEENSHQQQQQQHKQHGHHIKHYAHSSSTPHIPTSEAVEKLQHRFTQLMSQVADLTEDKQRLEHLVLQLQSETETIGEYITLYQTQRRILKQREYEKAAQMQLLQEEREQLRDKISVLNNLVSSLGVELPHNTRLKEHLNAALAQNSSNGDDIIAANMHTTAINNAAAAEQQELLAEMALNEKLNSTESQEILTKIQNIITEIKENTREVPTVTTQAADHLNCCSGKFEVV